MLELELEMLSCHIMRTGSWLSCCIFQLQMQPYNVPARKHVNRVYEGVNSTFRTRL